MTKSISHPLAWACLLVVLSALPAWGQNPNVTVNDQPTAEQKLEEVLTLRRADRYDQAAELIQEMIVSARFKLVTLGEGSYADAGRWATELLLRDGALRKAYTQRYDAAATRATEQANQSDDRLAALLEVYRQFAATPAGFEAGATAAGLLLEAGEARSAATLTAELVRHPERGEAKPRVLMLQGAAAAYLQDAVLLEEVLEQLADDSPEQVATLKALSDSIEPTSVEVRAARVDMGVKPVSITAPLWEQPLSNAQGSQRWLLADTATVPRVTSTSVLINNGRQIVMLNRASGQRAWSYPGDDDEGVDKIISAQRWSDQRSVAYAEGKAVAVLGECHGITERRNPYVPPNHLACVDAQTGKLIWRRTAGVFRPDEPTLLADQRQAGRINLQQTHFVGSPVMGQGVVLVVLRRVSNEDDTQSTWLLAFDGNDGSLRWYRHLALASMSYTNADAMRVTPQITLAGQTAIMSDGLGTVGAIDLHTGGYRWLRVLPIGSENTKSIVANTRGVTGKPVITSAGLLVPLSLRSDRLMLLDPKDGSVLRTFQQDPVLGKAQYILDAPGGALAVSTSSVSFWDADKATVAWTYSLQQGETTRAPAAVSMRFAVIPTNLRLIVLDMASGRVVEQAEATVGAVTLYAGELVCIGERKVKAYTTWDRVYDRLVQQVRDKPRDPSAGLSLASIALKQVGQEQSVLQGVEHALDAVSLQPMSRRTAVASHVFEQLRMMVMTVEDHELRSALYDRLGLVTQTASHEAAYHLDAGLYFASQGQATRAISHLHAVIAEPVFAAASYQADGFSRPAGTVAQDKIQQLIEQYGRSVYARQDALAQAKVDQIMAQGNIDPAALAAVARQFPLSPVAGQLLLDAADARFAEGKLIAAASLYQQAILRAVDRDQLQLVTGRLLQFYLETDRPSAASTFLDRLSREHPELQPLAGNQPVTPQQWAERIAQAPGQSRSAGPLAASFGVPVLIKGQLIAAANPSTPKSSRDRLYLFQEDRRVTCHSLNQLGKPVWSVAMPEAEGPVLLLADHREQVVFWTPHNAQVIAVDPADGEILWQTVVPFDETGLAQLPKPSIREFGKLVTVSDTVICIGQRDSAEVIAIDRAQGTVLWRTRLEMTALTAMDADDWSVAVVGRAGHPQQLRSGKLYVLNLADAKPLLPDGPVRIALTPFGVGLDRDRITVLGASGVLAVKTTDGKPLWSQRLSDNLLTGTFAIASDRIAVQSNDGEVHILDAANNGKPLGTIPVRGGGDRRPTLLTASGPTLWGISPRGVFRFGEDRLLDWTHAIESPGVSPLSLVVGKDHVALIAQPDLAPKQNGLKLLLLETAGGRLVEQYDIGPLDALAPLQPAMHFGNGLAIPVGGQTMVIPAE